MQAESTRAISVLPLTQKPPPILSSYEQKRGPPQKTPETESKLGFPDLQRIRSVPTTPPPNFDVLRVFLEGNGKIPPCLCHPLPYIRIRSPLSQTVMSADNPEDNEDEAIWMSDEVQ